ncbi:hypothetical protein ACFE04_001599 [Oxalis oulophora]
MSSKLLPEDLIEEILCSLPVKSLLRFTILSKPICSLILNDRRFIKRQLVASNETGTSQFLVMPDVLKFYAILLYDFDNSIIGNNRQVVNHPFENQPQGLTNQVPVIGSCDGLLCLFSWERGDIALVNPMTRKNRILPRLEITDGLCIHGFAYDPSSDDYVIVKMSQRFKHKGLKSSCCDRDVAIYSLRTNAWRILKDEFPDYCLSVDQTMATIVCGIRKTNKVVAFDLDMKNANLLPLPDSFETTLSRLHLSNLGGCLSIIVVQPRMYKADVWLMKEYGVKQSWEKLFSFSSGGVIDVCINDILSCLAYSKNKDQVLMQVFDNCMFWYDLKKKQANVIEDMPLGFGANVIVGSLVSVGATEEIKKKQKAKVVKKR